MPRYASDTKRQRVKTITDVVGHRFRDRVGNAFGSRFKLFHHRQMDGLVSVRGPVVDFLALRADSPGKGQFTRFLWVLKTVADSIGVYDVLNKRFGRYLERNGFVVGHEIENDESVEVYRWRKRP